MAVKIRLSRGGSKKRPYYRIVAVDSRSPRDGSFIEQVGHYDPMLPKDADQRIGLKPERIQYWLDVGAQPTKRVAKFLGQAGLIEPPSVPVQTKQHLPKAKAQEKLKAAEQAAKAKQEQEKEQINEENEQKAAETKQEQEKEQINEESEQKAAD